MSDQPPPGVPQPPSENQVPDPWAAAQESDFLYRPPQPGETPQGAPYQGGQAWGAQGDSHWGAIPGSRPDTDPYAEKKVGPLPRAESAEVKTGKRLAIGCGVAAVLVALVGIVAGFVYFRSSTKSGIESIDAALATKARLALDQAVRDQQIYFAQNDKYTDDPVTLMRQGGNARYVKGTATSGLDEVAVQLCDDVSGVIMQTQVKKDVYFAAFISVIDSVPYWARGQQPCPTSLDDSGSPGEPWSSSDAVLTGKTPTGEPRSVVPPSGPPSVDPDEDSGPLSPTPTGRYPTPTDLDESPFP